MSILLASAVCAAKYPRAAVAAGAVGAVGAVGAAFVWRISARNSRDSESVLKMAPEMSTLTFPPRPPR